MGLADGETAARTVASHPARTPKTQIGLLRRRSLAATGVCDRALINGRYAPSGPPVFPQTGNTLTRKSLD
ncbi:MAG: hypothetical protein D6680_08915 [Cyanobacteria bacterium J007]|nr:MAG: hypothetical protein D6680_08915 [Cyanobacteria bacterium J007]